MEMMAYLTGALIAVIPAVIWIWTLVDVIKSDFSGNNKVIWILVVVFLPFMGVLLYWLFGRSQKVSKAKADLRIN